MKGRRGGKIESVAKVNRKEMTKSTSLDELRLRNRRRKGMSKKNSNEDNKEYCSVGLGIGLNSVESWNNNFIWCSEDDWLGQMILIIAVLVILRQITDVFGEIQQEKKAVSSNIWTITRNVDRFDLHKMKSLQLMIDGCVLQCAHICYKSILFHWKSSEFDKIATCENMSCIPVHPCPSSLRKEFSNSIKRWLLENVDNSALLWLHSKIIVFLWVIWMKWLKFQYILKKSIEITSNGSGFIASFFILFCWISRSFIWRMPNE